MIKSFHHKGLRLLYESDDGKHLPPDMLVRIGKILLALGDAGRVEELDLPTYKLHALKGSLRGFWSITVRANWRVVFRFEGGNAFDVEFVDYH